MSEQHDFNPRLYSEDLAPTTPEKRTWSTYNYAALWIGMAHCIPTYMMAAGLLKEGMNWWQALLTILLGNLIVLVPMLLNSHGGTRYGIPFPVLCRSAFGVWGANFPALLRALVACGWFGIQTWIGGAALDHLLCVSFGWPSHAMLCFFLFWGLNIWIIWKGMDAVRWFEGWAAPAVLVVTMVLLVYTVQRAGGMGPILNQPGQMEDPAVFLARLPVFLTAQIGFWATLSLNMPDFTRYARNQRAQALGQTLGLPTTMTLFSAMGVVITSATEVVYGRAIWDPAELVAQPDFAHPVVVLLSLLTIGIATLSVNVAANVVSPAFDFANLWPSRIGFRAGGTITGVLGILIQPWNLLAGSSAYIFTWLVGYSGLLGPIAGVMVCDYWVLRRARLHVDDLYSETGRYRFAGGWNPWAVLALLAGALPNVPGFWVHLESTRSGQPVEAVLAAVSPAWQGFFAISARVYDFAWMVGFAISFVLFWVLMKGPGARWLPGSEVLAEPVEGAE